jgi:uncharacterized damage-inducible protein DinB
MHDYFVQLFRYVAWANHRVIDALQNQPPAQREALPLVAHLLAAEHIWLSRLRGSAATVAVWPQLTLDQCVALAEENASGYASFLTPLGPADFACSVSYRNTKGIEFLTPVLDILTHVATHGSYHRGQVAKAFGRAGCQAVNTDFITFVREK